MRPGIPYSGENDFGAPVLAVCGFSGSGKTTLLEAALPQLTARGLSVAVIKHDAHGFVVDKPGKDSDRLFRAGATVALRGPSEQFFRRAGLSGLSLRATLADLAQDHDLLLVEGHKATPLPKLWVGNAETTTPPDDVTGVQAILPWDSDRLSTFLSVVDAWLPKAWTARPLYAGLLIGGKSSRMGRPKQLMEFCGRPLGEIVGRALSEGIGEQRSHDEAETTKPLNQNLVLLGAGRSPEALEELPRLQDPPGLAGPIAGLLAAHRWAPRAAWVLAACDHPWLSPSDICWLVNQRRAGVWAIVPRQPDGYPCPTLALYEPQSLTVLERAVLEAGGDKARIATLLEHARTLIRPWFTRGLVNVNSPEDWMAEETLAEGNHRFSQRRMN